MSRRVGIAIAVGGLAVVGLGVGALVQWGRDGAIVVATVATAASSAVLAWVTVRLVDVTREMATEPALVPALHIHGGNVFLELLNAGDGAALDVDLTIDWKLGNNVGGTVSGGTRKWRSSVLPAGRRVRFNPPQLENAGWLQGDTLVAFERISVTGTMANSRRQLRSVDASIEEPGEVYDLEVEAKRQYSSNYEPDEISAESLRKIAEILAGETKQSQLRAMLKDTARTQDVGKQDEHGGGVG